jgi:hypothetical protein
LLALLGLEEWQWPATEAGRQLLPGFEAANIQANQSLDFAEFLRMLDRTQELRGIRVVFYDGYKMHVVRRGQPLCGRGVRAVVIKPDIGETTLWSSELAAAHEGRVYAELLNVGLGCGGAIVAWSVIGGAAGAVPLTGGTSLIVEKMAFPAAIVGSLSCINSGVRLYNEVRHPERNDILDQHFWYQGAVAFMDAVGLFGATTAASATVKMVLHLRNTTGKTMLQVLKGLNRQQRKRLAEESVRLANPGISNQALKMFVNAGTFPKRYSTVQVSHTVKQQLKDAFGAACGYTGSAYDGLVNRAGNAAKDSVSPPPTPKQTVYGSYVLGLAYSFETF